MTTDEFCHIQIQRFSPPHRQIFLRLRDGLFSLAQISFDFFDTTPANVRTFFILRVNQCRPRPFFPVFRTFKEHHGTFHAVFNTLRITTGAAFAVMPHKNGLTGRDHRGQSFHFIKYLCGFTGLLSAVSGKPLRPCFLTFSERAVFILNLSGEWLSIIRVNKSNGAVSSVTTPNYSFLGYSGTMKVTPDRITDYKAPSAEEAAVASQAAKRPPVVNYPGEGFREMTKAQWAALPRDCKAVRSVAEAEDHGAYRYRRTMDNNFRLVNVYITDMKITEIPQK